MRAVNAEWLESRPKGTVIVVIAPTGHHFELVAEGRAHRDYILHSGTPAYRLGGRRARYGTARLFWPVDDLAAWVANGLCSIELSTQAGGAR